MRRATILGIPLALAGIAPFLPWAAGARSAAPFQPLVVYRGDMAEDGVFDLFAANAEGTQVLTLSGGLGTGEQVEDFQWSPDRKLVAFTIYDVNNGQSRLFVVPANGGDRKEVTVPLGPQDSAPYFAWSPKSQRLAYARLFDDNGTSRTAIHTVDPDGTDDAIAAVSQPNAGASSDMLRWSPNGAWLAFALPVDVSGQSELHVCRADATDTRRVSGDLVALGDVFDYVWAPNGSRIAYTANQDVADRRELYTVKPDGTDPKKVGALLAADSNVFALAWSPNSQRIAYSADRDTSFIVQLYVAGAKGGFHADASGPLPLESDVSSFAWAPNGKLLTYLADRFVNAQSELFVSRFDGSAPIRVSGLLPAGSDVMSGMAWLRDSSRIVYRTSSLGLQSSDVLSVRPDGSQRTSLASPIVAGGNVNWLAVAPKSSRVAFVADREIDEIFEVYVADPDGSGWVKISGTLSGELDASFATWSTKEDRVVYRVREGPTGPTQLFAAKPDGTSTIPITPASPVGGSTFQFTVR